MNGLKGHILAWLNELEEYNAANLLNYCDVDNRYIDTLFSADSEIETYMHDVIVSVPLKIHSKLSAYERETLAIESAIKEAGESDGIYVRNISWRPYLIDEHKNQYNEKSIKIVELLSQEYVNRQLRLMNQSVEHNPHLALGISKELIETCCKHLLNKAGIEANKDWNVLKLVKETNKQIDLMPFEVDDVESAKSSIAKILGGFSTIVQGVAELRNSYGTGHGHSPEFKALDRIYSKLAVAASSELAVFYLSLEQLKKEKSSI